MAAGPNRSPFCVHDSTADIFHPTDVAGVVGPVPKHHALQTSSFKGQERATKEATGD